MTKSIYLDYAAATPLSREARQAMEPYFSEKFHNPSATYLAARAVRQDISAARQTAAGLLGSKPAEIIFTAGASEANNLAIRGIMGRFPDGEVIVSAIEHDSVLAPAAFFKFKLAPVDRRGIIDLEKLGKLINDKTVLVSVMLVNNELGTIQPVAEVAKLLNMLSKKRADRGIKRPLYLHTDAAQAGNYLDLHVARLGVDLMSLNGGKIYGPKQSGLLYIKAGIQLQPLVVGGGQEFGYRSGTEGVANIMGLVAALSAAQNGRQRESRRLQALRQLFEAELIKSIPGVQINGSQKHRAPHIVSVTFPGTDNERLMMELDERGVQAAVGSACSASSDQPSHVLAAIGLDEAAARSSLRFSFGNSTSTAGLTRTVGLLKSLTTVN